MNWFATLSLTFRIIQGLYRLQRAWQPDNSCLDHPSVVPFTAMPVILEVIDT